MKTFVISNEKKFNENLKSLDRLNGRKIEKMLNKNYHLSMFVIQSILKKEEEYTLNNFVLFKVATINFKVDYDRLVATLETIIEG